MKLDDETIDVLIGGYLSEDAAEEDYNAVLDCGGHLQGAVVVSKDLEGNLSVEQTDHMVREGAEGLGAVGFAVGLFAPPLLAATAIGVGIGALLGHLSKRHEEKELGVELEEYLPPGSSAVVAVVDDTYADKVEAALVHSQKRINKAIDKGDYDELQKALAQSSDEVANAVTS